MPNQNPISESSRPRFSYLPISFLNGIPSFVEGDSYASSFGAQWIKHTKTQLDSQTGSDITRERLQRMFGPLFHELKGKLILEAGCGAGRFTEILLQEKALVDAFDLSDAVVANLENNGHHSNLRILKASITDIPFEAGQFDFVFCPGVIQHTPNPDISLKELFKQVKPGGWLVFDQYRYNLSSTLRSSQLIRPMLKRLKPEMAFKVTDTLVNLWLPLHRKVKNLRFLEILLFRISPITSHYSGYPELSEPMQIAWAKLNTHDNLTDFHKHHTTLKKLRETCNRLGAINQFYCVMPYTIEVRCQKPYLEVPQNYNMDVSISDLRKTGIVSG